MKLRINNTKCRNGIRVFKFIFLVTLLIALALPGIALASDDVRNTPRFTDEVGLLSESQVSELTAKLDEISVRHQFDVVVTIAYSLDGKNPRVFAADFYENQGFGYGENGDGIILMLAMEHRDFAFATKGHGLYVFTDAGQEHMEGLFLPYLRNDEYFEAFMAFADAADTFLIRAEEGERYEAGNIPVSDSERLTNHLIAAAISLVIAFIVPGIVVWVWTNQLKSVRKKDFACNYIRQGSMQLTLQRDTFLYRNVTRTARQQSSSGGGSSGSFRSSSGSSFSGRSGKF